MKKKIIISIILALVFILIFFVGYLTTRKKPSPPLYIPEEKREVSAPTPLTPIFPSTPTPSPTQPTPQISLPYELLFNKELIYISLDYPLLYVYDPSENIIKYLNLEDETYKEIFRISNLKKAFLSPDKTKIFLETNQEKYLLDLQNDALQTLPSTLQNFVFTPKDLILYLNNNKNISYLAYFKDGKASKIRDLGILNPKLNFYNNQLLIYEKGSSIFSLDLKSPDTLFLFLEAKSFYSLLPSKEGNLLFVSLKDGTLWQSQILDFKKKLVQSFSWASIEEKCTFSKTLVCSVPSNLENFDPEKWELEPSYDKKIIIYDPLKKSEKEIILEGKFDILKPQLTPLGIIFWDRLTQKFYLIKPEKLPLD